MRQDLRLLFRIKHLGRLVKSGIEIFPEITFDRFAQELVYANLFFLALCESVLTDMPAMQVESTSSVAQGSYADRIEPA